MKKFLFACVFVFSASFAFAQATPGKTLGWDQDAPDLATANAYIYRHYDDASAVGVVITPVVCVNQVPVTSTFTCTVAFPAFTPGAHTMALTAGNAAGESLKSNVLAFTFVVIPTPPKGLRIQ